MNRRVLLEMCLVSLLSLPEDELLSLIPTLAAMAEPHLPMRGNSRACLDQLRACLQDILTGLSLSE